MDSAEAEAEWPGPTPSARAAVLPVRTRQPRLAPVAATGSGMPQPPAGALSARQPGTVRAPPGRLTALFMLHSSPSAPAAMGFAASAARVDRPRCGKPEQKHATSFDGSAAWAGSVRTLSWPDHVCPDRVASSVNAARLALPDGRRLRVRSGRGAGLAGRRARRSGAVRFRSVRRPRMGLSRRLSCA